MTDLVQQLATELAVRSNQVEAAIKLIDEGQAFHLSHVTVKK